MGEIELPSKCGISFKKEDENRNRRQNFTKPKSTILIEGQSDSEAVELDKRGERTP